MSKKLIALLVVTSIVIGYPFYNFIHDKVVIQEVKSTIDFLENFNIKHNRYPTVAEFGNYIALKKEKVDPEYKFYAADPYSQSFSFTYHLNSFFTRESAPGHVGRDTGFYIGNSVDSCQISKRCGRSIEALKYLSHPYDDQKIFLSVEQGISFNNTWGCSGCTRDKFISVDYDHSYFVAIDDAIPVGVLLYLKAVKTGDTVLHAETCILTNGQCSNQVNQEIKVNIVEQATNTPRRDL